MSSNTSFDNQFPVLGAVLRTMAPLVRWLVRSGVGYTEFASAIKPIFLVEARSEAVRTGGKTTDSALSLLSGLHRKDVRHAALDTVTSSSNHLVTRPSLPSQVVARWVASDLPDTLSLFGEPSFETLVKSISCDLHPRAVQHELARLGVVCVTDDSIALVRRAFTPDPSKNESHQLLADNVADHLSAGVHNLTEGVQRKYLEQSVFADGLCANSVKSLEQLANQLWKDVMTCVVKAAVPLCEHDEPLGGTQRLRLGMFCYAEPMADLSFKTSSLPATQQTNTQKQEPKK